MRTPPDTASLAGAPETGIGGAGTPSIPIHPFKSRNDGQQDESCRLMNHGAASAGFSVSGNDRLSRQL